MANTSVVNTGTLLIVGIDPGTTVGYAALNLEGEALHVGSDKNISMSEIIERLIPFGKVLIVGTDKSKIPSYVEKFQAKAGGVLVRPVSDLGIDEKKHLCRNFKYANDHELDALASALAAYKKYRSLFRKINKFLEENGIMHLKHSLTRLVVEREISIANALDLLTQKPQKIEKKQLIRTTVETEFSKLKRRLKFVESYNEYLKSKNKKLQRKIKRLKADKRNLIRTIDYASEHKARKLLENKNKKFINIAEEKESISKNLKNLESEYAKLTELLRSNDFVSIPRVPSLGNIKISREACESEFLFVDDPGIISAKTLEKLKCRCVIHNKKPGKKLSFHYLRSQDISHELFEGFAMVNKHELEKELNKKERIAKIVSEYKRRFDKNMIKQ